MPSPNSRAHPVSPMHSQESSEFKRRLKGANPRLGIVSSFAGIIFLRLVSTSGLWAFWGKAGPGLICATDTRRATKLVAHSGHSIIGHGDSFLQGMYLPAICEISQSLRSQ